MSHNIGSTSVSSASYNYFYFNNHGPDDEDIVPASSHDPAITHENEINENDVEDSSTSETDSDSHDMDIENEARQAQMLLEKISPAKLPLRYLRVQTTPYDDLRKLAVKRTLLPNVRRYDEQAAMDKVKSEAETLKAHSALDVYDKTGDENALKTAEENIVKAQAYDLRKNIYSIQKEFAQDSYAQTKDALHEKKQVFKKKELKDQERYSVPFAGKTIGQGARARQEALERESQAAIERQAAIFSKGKNIFQITGRFSNE